MKKTFLIIVFFLSFFVSKAQYIDDSYDWYPRQIGVKVGINSTSFNDSKNQSENVVANADAKFGYTASVAYWIPITQMFRPRFELSYDVMKSGVDFTTSFKSGASYSFAGNSTLSYGSLAILPEVVFGKKIQFSIFAGFQFSALIQANEKGESTSIDSSNTIVSVLQIDRKDNTIAEGIDSGLLSGFGVRYRLSKKMQINAEGRFRFGTTMIYGIYKPYYWGISTGLVYQL